MSSKTQKLLEALSHIFAALAAEPELWQALEATDSFFNHVLLVRIARANTSFVVLILLLKNGVGPMVLKEKQLFIRQKYAQKQSKVCMDANKAPDVQVLFEACGSPFTQLNFLLPRAEPVDPA